MPRKPTLSLDSMREIARERGGECLSESFSGVLGKLRYRCANGHEFEALTNNVARASSWCPSCSGRAPYALADFAEVARERGGECLSSTYASLSEPLSFRCANGHEFERTGKSVKDGGWCDECVREERREKLARVAESRGGRLLSERYLGSHEKHLFVCSQGHEFEALATNVENKGTWCSACSGRGPLSLSDFAEIARERGGECISTSYARLSAPLRFRCANGHEFERSGTSLKNGGWCDECVHDERYERLAGVARSRGGRLVSERYLGAHKKHVFECSAGHVFSAAAHHVTNSAMWCAACAGKKG